MNAGTIIAQLQLNADRYNRGLREATGELTTFSKGAKTVAKGVGVAIAGLSTVVIGLGAVFTKLATEQNTASTKMQASTGLTTEQMKEMDKQASNLFKKGIANYEEAYSTLTQVKTVMGLVGDEAGLASEQALILSNTFGYEVSESIRAVSSVTKNFKTDSTQAFDVITKLSQQAGDKAGDLLDTFNEYSPIMAQMGISFEDFGNMLATGMEKGSFNFDKIGDALKEFNVRSQDGSKSTGEAFTSLGMNAEEMGRKFASGGDVGKQAFNEVVSAIEGVKDPMEQNAIGVALFGSMYEDLGKDIVLSLGSAEGALGEFNGATAKAGEVLQSSLSSKLTRIKNSFLDFGVNIIQTKLMPVFQQLADWVLANMPMIETVVGTAFTILGSTIGTLVTILSTMIGFIIQHKEFFTALALTITAILLPAIVGMTLQFLVMKAQALATLIPTLITWIATNYALAVSQLAAYAPILIIIAVIALLVGAIMWVVKNWDMLKTKTLEVWEIIKSYLLEAWEALKQAWETVWNAMKQVFEAVWNGIKAVGEAIWNAILFVFKLYFNAIKLYFTTILLIYKTIFTVAWTAIKAVGIAIWNGIKVAFTAVWNALKITFSTVWNTITTIFTTVVNKIKSLGANGWNALKDGFTGAIGIVVDTFKGLYDKVMGSLSNLIGGIKDKVMQAKEWLTELNPFKRHSPSLVDNVLAGVKQIKDTYNSVSDMSITAPSIGSVSAGHYATGMFEAEGVSGSSASSTNYNAPLVQVESMTVRSDEDIRSVSNELYNLQRNSTRSGGK